MCFLVSVLVITCLALAFLGYYQLQCEELELLNTKKTTVKQTQQTHPHSTKTLSTFPERQGNQSQFHSNDKLPTSSERDENSNDQGNHTHQRIHTNTSPTHDHAIKMLSNISSGSQDNYQRGTCRLPCQMKRRQQLCPKRSNMRKEPPDEAPSDEQAKGKELVVITKFGNLQGMFLL